uniref:Cilia-and flagella-associated protein 96 n=1 Tax=Chromera velia CCMP2878 TaxID=1169474 RepID=A0A0G4GTY5_9ALVE|eukprot:Cvel_5209.t1-p1 / transcript=Cvel_5209.t1 / gene=Cvel_5209 / organism=Chromera_velia_CCMP2878 / gene_product=hypothetical protein / transcript_product=hypothetical protein / location=Cvel_scaffold239:109062-110664(+) / protein_length=199 / sequence_SO=supercontig / SO=protein_coding / is_pseudo=false
MDETARQTLRAEVLKESFAAAGEARHGFIGYMPPLAVADNSLEPITNVRKGDDAGWMPKNFVTGQAKKGNGPDSYLMYIPPLAPGSPFVDTHKIRLRETKGAPVDPDRNFKPPGTVKTSTNKTGYVYMEMSPDPVDPKDLYAKHKDRAPLKNFVTAPARRGGKGVFAPDIYFEKPSEYLHSDYEAEKKLRCAGDGGLSL